MSRLDAGSRHGPAGFIVRRLRPEEWPRLRDLRLRALADAPDAFGSTLEREQSRSGDQWRAWITDPDRILVVAERGGRLVAMASGGPAPGGGPGAGLYGMWVEPAVRGSGIAAAIAGAVVDWARERGDPGIALEVITSNARVIALYERLGFLDTGDRYPLRAGSNLVVRTMTRSLDGTDRREAGPG